MPSDRIIPRQKRKLPSKPSQIERDVALLELAFCNDETLADKDERAFYSMYQDLKAGKLRELSPKQRTWVEGFLTGIDVALPPENAVSNGLVPKQRVDVPLPAVLRRLPLKPPGKGGEWRER